MIGALIGAGISAAGGLIGSYMQNKAQKEMNEKNLSFQKENLDYQKHLQQQIFEREDTAHQREVKDLRSAGLNPLLSTGAGAGAGSVVPTEAMQTNYAPDYSGIASGFASAGQGIASAERWKMDYDMKQEMQQEQLLQMKAQRQKIAADTLNSLLGYNRGSAEFGEWSLTAPHRQEQRDYEEAFHSLDIAEKSGRISHAEAEERRKDLQSKREENIYEHNLDYAKKHERPYGTVPTGLEGILDLGARLLDHHEGGVNYASSVIKDVKETLAPRASSLFNSKNDKRVTSLIDTTVTNMSNKPYSEVVKSFESAARNLGYRITSEDLKKLHEAYSDEKSRGSTRSGGKHKR